MPGRVYPSSLVNPVSVLGYCGGDWRALVADYPTDGDPALRVSMVVDRSPNWVSTFYQALGVAPHASTTRWTYTVPSGKRALVLAFFLKATTPSTGEVSSTWITLNTYYLAQMVTVSTTPADAQVKLFPAYIWLKAGDALTGVTYLTGTANADFACNAFVMEFDG